MLTLNTQPLSPTAFETYDRQDPREPKQLAEPDIETPEAELRSECLKSRASALEARSHLARQSPLEARSHLARHTAPAAIAARRCLVAEHPGGGAMVTALPLVHARLFFSRPWGLVEGGPSGCALTRTSSGSGCLRGPLFSFVSARSFPPPLRIAGGRPPPVAVRSCHLLRRTVGPSLLHRGGLVRGR